MATLSLFPVRDFRVLFGLRWRQFKDSAVYWLRVLGYEPGGRALMQAGYVLYLAGIGALWLLMMWGWAYSQAEGIANNLAPATVVDLLNLLPVIVLVAQVWTMVGALRSTPLKLSFPDMAYIAGSPIARSIPVLLGFLRTILGRMILFGAVAALLAVAIIPGAANAGPASLRAAGAAALLLVLTWALAWLLGISRLAFIRLSNWPLLWVAPLLLLALAYVYPAAVLWPGQALILAIFGVAPVWLFPALLLIALVLVIAFVWLGNRINMIHAADESAIYARISALGLMAYRDPRLQARIRLQSSSAARSPWFKLPKTTGFSTLVFRALLSYVRHPFMLLTSFAWGAAITILAVWIVSNALPFQVWVGWLLVIGFAPPVGLLHVFRADLEEPFLRQFMPVDGLQLLVADVLLPLVSLIFGGLAGWFWIMQGREIDLIGLGLLWIPLLSVLLTLVGAVSLTYERVLQTRLIATALVFGSIMVAGANFSILIALIVAGFALLLLFGMVMQNA